MGQTVLPALLREGRGCMSAKVSMPMHIQMGVPATAGRDAAALFDLHAGGVKAGGGAPAC
eukprot:scaffold206569_cov18-Tisochrysis_lutea.AAC.1